MTFTSAATIKEVLRDLGALDALDVVSAEDAARVNDLLGPVTADLALRRVVVIDDVEAIPDAYFRAFVDLLVEHAASRFGKEADPAKIQAAEGRLAGALRLTRTGTTPLVQAVLEQLDMWGAGSFAVDPAAVSARIQPALDNLAARNVIYIADEDAVADMLGVQAPFTRYLAAWLSPKPMGEVIAQAEAELRTLSRIGKGTGRMLRVDPALRPRRPFGRMI